MLGTGDLIVVNDASLIVLGLPDMSGLSDNLSGFLDGCIVVMDSAGRKMLHLPNSQKSDKFLLVPWELGWLEIPAIRKIEV